MNRPSPPHQEPLQQLGVVATNYEPYARDLENYANHLESLLEQTKDLRLYLMTRTEDIPSDIQEVINKEFWNLI